MRRTTLPVIEYAAPSTNRRAGMNRPPVALAICNVLVGAIAVLGTNLALHVTTCTAGEQWCHLMALAFGVPHGLISTVLAGLSIQRLLVGWRPLEPWARVLLTVPIGFAILVDATMLGGVIAHW